MQIKYNKENKKDFCQVNFYKEESEKKLDTKSERFLNFKIEKEINRKKFILFIRLIIRKTLSDKIEKLSFDYEQIKKINLGNISESDKLYLFIINIKKAAYVFDGYKSEKKEKIKEVLIFGNISPEEKKVCTESEKISDEINFARDLANTPASEMMPTDLLLETKRNLKGVKNINIKVVEESEAKKLGMGLYLAVGQASINKSKFIIIKYSGAKNSEKPTVLIGKGICYDTGGLSLKPTKGMLGMEMDMTGGAVVIAAISAIAKLEMNKNVVAVIPAVENAISAKAYRPGDILTAMNKTTVEIGNTDAEGRLVLADAITYSLKKLNPKRIIDVATLTGASLVAVGQRASVFMTNSEKLQKDLMEMGEKTGDSV